MYIKKFLKFKGFQLSAYFSLPSVVANILAFLFYLNKSFKTYSGTMLPPVGRNWQLIYPNYSGIHLIEYAGNTKRGSITVLLTCCLTGLD
jgi:hypothetical protein